MILECRASFANSHNYFYPLFLTLQWVAFGGNQYPCRIFAPFFFSSVPRPPKAQRKLPYALPLLGETLSVVTIATEKRVVKRKIRSLQNPEKPHRQSSCPSSACSSAIHLPCCKMPSSRPCRRSRLPTLSRRSPCWRWVIFCPCVCDARWLGRGEDTLGCRFLRSLTLPVKWLKTH